MFFKKLIPFALECSYAYCSGKKKVKELGDIMSRILSEDEEVLIEEFLEAYDVRSYNFHSKQNDIKFMKSIDFAGIYILHNLDKNIYFVGKSGKVFRKINRHFRGYENKEVYKDWKNRNKFTVQIISFESSEYNDINVLEKEIRKQYLNVY